MTHIDAYIETHKFCLCSQTSGLTIYRHLMLELAASHQINLYERLMGDELKLVGIIQRVFLAYITK